MSSLEEAGVHDWPLPELWGGAPAEADTLSPAGPSAEALAYARGLEEGRREAAAEADRVTQAARQALIGAAESLQAVRAAYASEVEDALYALATALAHQLVQRELSLDAAVVRDLVRRAVEILPLEGALEIKLHPADLAALGGDVELYAPGGRKLDVRWVADGAIDRGGYVIETPQRVVDGRIDPVLQAMYQRLRDG
ncbi:MAG TPA: FliH/SctL family protein [Gemmatimonadales bacterium]|nr:FliH/SctL family protein [Gemmatimonadales bacterium]